MHQLTPEQAGVVVKVLAEEWDELVARCNGDIKRAADIITALSEEAE